MLHSTLETIARLVDEAPTTDEAAHLASCDDCSRELDAIRQQTFALTNLGDSKPPRESWTALEKRLEREGLIAWDPAAAAVIPIQTTRARFNSGLLRAAAAIVIFLLGGLGGAWVRGTRANVVAVGQPAAQHVAKQQPETATLAQAPTQ